MRYLPSPVLALPLLTGCEPDTDARRAMPARPVTVLTLAERDYERERELTGVVSLYREEQIAFEIGGRVTMVLDEGLEVRGPTIDGSGKLVREGDPIAAMEGARYGSQVGALRAQVDFIETNVAAGRGLREAVADAGRVRVRPIVLTTLTTVGGLLPLSLFGGALWAPMTSGMIAGLLVSTVLTLFVIPSLYVLMAEKAGMSVLRAPAPAVT